MKIGDVARVTGLSVKSIRYYHDINLVSAKRGENGYRVYDKAALESLRFVHQCREMGFSIEECRSLLALQQNPGRAAGDVRALAQMHLGTLEDKISRMQALQRQLAALVAECQGGEQSQCPILASLATDNTADNTADNS
ncbi:MerR family DNA-binding protein [Shewanella sp. JM162201]|uniref:HTH-type transcriptional regulator CueR n=1 Tax=Shewanella jiangmenensis TaxID=2837387 RepID=A0ABS5V5L8_9GAMM|nr:MerR family DNA-binding protein [Shewanella jiangmenensis]MBT1444979.1 MerR family DNA-binding protein [Shewanella jiangmenensis]